MDEIITLIVAGKTMPGFINMLISFFIRYWQCNSSVCFNLDWKKYEVTGTIVWL
jgi:hypothetical protein